ncbi:MAG: DNA gyrase subunit A [Theionarchaea archaeon]|nr:DNA gyrase subunit A [Theionarchaea archaeon]
MPNIVETTLEEEMKDSYIDYAMSVIAGRALPNVKDGLKPVHRRILYAMNQMGLTFDKPTRKSARVVGEVLGKYHPHGDAAVYDTLVRMVQDFSLRYPLVEGQGNFGSVDGDSPAAMRYTEARMAPITHELLSDIEKETVEFVPNFDGSLQEPLVLPAKLPNLLINGSSGIAVGMATNIPPHNLREVAEALIVIIDTPDVSTKRLMKVVKAPDFPTGGLIYGRSGIQKAYRTGKGKLVLRGRAHIDEKNGVKRIVITEIPYQVNKAKLIEDIAALVREKHIEGISDLRDESDREGMRIVIEVHRDAVPEIVLNQLFKHTNLQTTFGIIMLALVDGEPRILTLKQILQEYINHRVDVIRKRTEYDLKKARERAHILEGLLIALDNIDEVIRIIRQSQKVEEAREALQSRFNLTEKQARAILDMRLQRLVGLEREKISEELTLTLEKIDTLEKILASRQAILSVIKEELLELAENFGDERRSEIVEEQIELTMEDLIPKEDVVVTITRGGYIKKTPIDVYRRQKRGGKGVVGIETKEEDIVEHLFITSTHDYILFFTDKGKIYWLKAYDVPTSSRTARGKPIVNLLKLQDESITAAVSVKEFPEDEYLVMITKNGMIKKTALSEYGNPRPSGIIAITLKDDELVTVIRTDGNQEIFIATAKGKAILFHEGDVRCMGRSAMGVKGISLRKNDSVVGMITISEGTVLTVTELGYAKRTLLDEYSVQHRGGKGVIAMKINQRTGDIAGMRAVKDTDEALMISQQGKLIRIPVKGIRIMGRATQGVIAMTLDEFDRVGAVTIVESD